jgi:cytochrome oxidase Cu insertion factor (SCO1/SenC/PrrC family)
MPTESRTTVGGKRGYTIEKVVVTDEDGNVLSESFELYDPDGNLIGTYPSLEEAEEALDEEIGQRPPTPGMGM